MTNNTGDASNIDDDVQDLPFEEYTPPLFSDNEDELSSSVMYTGGNDGFADCDYNDRDEELQSLQKNTITTNKRKYIPETATDEIGTGDKNSNPPKINKVEEAEKDTDNKKCIHCIFDKELDKRNYYFGNLLIGELQFLPPCMRSQAYIDILKYIETLKNKHINKK